MNMLVLLSTFIGYTVFIGGIVYFCVIADPQVSPTAHFLSITLPQKCYAILQERLGSRTMQVIEWFGDRAMLLTYCVVVFGSWSIIFVYVYPWIDEQNYVSKYHKLIGIVVFAACFLSWRYASRTSPGIITTATVARYDIYPYDNLMYVPGKICPTRQVPRLARSKFDRYKYKQNIPRFDHFCGWIDNTVGEENYRWFLLFLAIHVAMCAYGTSIVGMLFYGEILEKGLLQATYFNRQTGEEISADKWIIVQYLFSIHTSESCVLLLMGAMSVALALFLGYHCGLTSKNLTTNESYKWSDVKRWHKREMKRYQEAAKNGERIYKVTQIAPPVYEGDVSYTPLPGKAQVEPTEAAKVQTLQSTKANASNIVEVSVEQLPDDAVIDPGPKPKNIYDRGIVENWKEVIFPLSLRNNKQKSKNT